MNVLLISRIPSYFETIRTDRQIFPPFQIQTYWLKGLVANKAETHVFICSNSLVFPTKIVARIDQLFQKKLPNLYHKWQKLKNMCYAVRPGNYIKSWQVIRLLKRESIDTIIIAGGISELSSLELKIAKQRKIKIIMLHGEDPLISATHYERKSLRYIDHIIVNDPVHENHWRQIGAKNAIAMPYSGIDPQAYRDKKKKRDIPVIFIGTLLPDRQRLLEHVIKFNIKLYGYIPPEYGLFDSLKPYYQGEAWGNQMIDLYNRSCIAINIAPDHMPIGGNLRLFEIPGCGALQIANRCPAEWYENNKDIVLFSNEKELEEKIAYYLKHEEEREKIAQSGYRKTHAEYSYTQRFSKILSL